jgi:hypothetical protein
VQQLFALRSLHFEKAEPARSVRSLIAIVVGNTTPPGQIEEPSGELLTWNHLHLLGQPTELQIPTVKYKF